MSGKRGCSKSHYSLAFPFDNKLPVARVPARFSALDMPGLFARRGFIDASLALGRAGLGWGIWELWRHRLMHRLTSVQSPSLALGWTFCVSEDWGLFMGVPFGQCLGRDSGRSQSQLPRQTGAHYTPLCTLNGRPFSRGHDEDFY